VDRPEKRTRNVKRQGSPLETIEACPAEASRPAKCVAAGNQDSSSTSELGGNQPNQTSGSAISTPRSRSPSGDNGTVGADKDLVLGRDDDGAAATDASGNTSEFSAPLAAPEACQITSIKLENGVVVIHWLEPAQLLHAMDLAGPWLPVAQQDGSATVLPGENAGFYRLVCP
jgi:hypothetical protein